MGGEVKGKLANAVGSQYPSHYLGTWCIQHYYRWCAHLGYQQSTELTPPADLNGLVRFAERRNLISARVPSHFNWPLQISLTRSTKEILTGSCTDYRTRGRRRPLRGKIPATGYTFRLWVPRTPLAQGWFRSAALWSTGSPARMIADRPEHICNQGTINSIQKWNNL